MKSFLIVVLLFSIVSVHFGQTTTILKTFGGSSTDATFGGGISSQGGFYLSGYTSSFGSGQNDGIITKLDSLGNLEWSRTIGLNGNDMLNDGEPTMDGGVVVVGTYRNGDPDALVAKLDSNGNLEWAKTYGTTGHDNFTNINEDANGNFLIAGFTESFNPGGQRDAIAVKIDATGNLIWVRTFGGYQNDWGREVWENANGYFFVGNSFSYGTGQHDGMIVQITPQGGLAGVRLIGTVADDQLLNMDVMSNGDGVFCGFATLSGKRRIWMMRMDIQGNIVWNNTYGFPNIDIVGKVRKANDGNLLVFAYETGNHSNGKSIILKLDSNNGNIIWANEYGGGGSEYYGDFGQMSNGMIYALGGTNTYGSGDYDQFVMTVHSNGSMDSCFYQDVKNQFIVQTFSPSVTFAIPSNQTNFISSNASINVTTPSILQTSICFLEDVQAFFESSQDTICAGECVQLINSSINANQYQWTITGANISSTNIPAPNNICFPNAGTYTIELIASNFTNADTTIRQIVVNDIPDFSLGNDTSFCDMDSFQLDVNLSNVTYQWQDNSNQSSYLAESTGNYAVTVTNSDGCVASDNIQLQFDFTPFLELGNDTIICEGNIVMLDAFTPNGMYLWNDNSISSVRHVDSSGLYFVEVQVGICSTSDTINIQVLDAPPIHLGIDTFICDNSFITLNAYNSLASSYLWQDGSTFATYEASNIGEYSVEVHYASGCINYDTIQIVSEPVIEISLPSDTTFCQGNPIILNAYHPNAKTYQWKGFSAYYGQNDLTDTSFIISLSGDYSIILNNGCRDLEHQINVIAEDCSCIPFIPNAFTPNGDGNNDDFQVYSNCEIETYNLQIYNRWGEKVFESDDINRGWDGQSFNQEAPIGVYVWKIEYTSADQSGHLTRKMISGDVTLIR
jgi:gliding motility-associated-like protein